MLMRSHDIDELYYINQQFLKFFNKYLACWWPIQAATISNIFK